MATRQLVRDFGTAIQFPGSGTVNISAGNIFNAGTGSLSILGWFYTTISGNQSIISKRNSSTSTESGYGVAMIAGGKMRTYFGDGTTGSDTSNISAALNTGKWHSFAFQIDRVNNLKKLHIDGSQVSSVDISAIGTQSNTNEFLVGATHTAASPSNIWNGIIDNILVLNIPVADADISNFHYLYLNPFTSGIQMYWKLDEGSGSTANDSSGNGNAGTITGASYTTNVFIVPRTSL